MTRTVPRHTISTLAAIAFIATFAGNPAVAGDAKKKPSETTGAIIHLAPTGKDELGHTPSSAGSTGWVNQSYSNKPAPKTTTTGTQFNPEQLPRSIRPK